MLPIQKFHILKYKIIDTSIQKIINFSLSFVFILIVLSLINPVMAAKPPYTECPNDDLLALGLIVGNNVYEATDVGFVRFEDLSAKGKGKSTAKDITDLFKWTGWVFDASLDISEDGIIDADDVPLSYDLLGNGGNKNGVIDSNEYENWLDDQNAAGLATYYENEWILNIADLVVTDQDISNDGVKLLKLRFYPVATTLYEQASE